MIKLWRKKPFLKGVKDEHCMLSLMSGLQYACEWLSWIPELMSGFQTLYCVKVCQSCDEALLEGNER